MTQQDRHAPGPRQTTALTRVTRATEKKQKADIAASAAREAWIEQMFEASRLGTAHAHVARAAGIEAESYRQLRKINNYDQYCANAERAA